ATGDQVIQVADAGEDAAFAGEDAAALGVGDDRFGVGDAGADADAGGLADVRAGAGEAHDLLDDLLHELRYHHLDAAARRRPLPIDPCILLHDLQALVDGLGIVRADDRADAVLERRDDAAAVGVVLGVGAEDQADVQVEADR